MTKICTSCKLLKPLSDYGKRSASKDGLKYICKLCCKNVNKCYYSNNKDHINKCSIKWQQENQQYYKEWSREYRDTNRDKCNESIKRSKAKNPDYGKTYVRERRNTDPLFKLVCNIRTLVSNSVKNGGYNKNSKTSNILGCSYEEFKTYLELKFTDDMSWQNYGKWHLDHIVPVSWALTEDQIIKLNHHSNFQPLWAEDNYRKKNNFAG
jgi:hypothetical protein